MNGNKVLNRLIQVFFIINILLLIMNINKLTKSYVLTKERVRDITSILQDRGVLLDKPLPKIFTPKVQGTISVPESTAESRELLVKGLLSTNIEEISIFSEKASSHYEKSNRVYMKDNAAVTFTKDEVIYSNNNLILGKSMDLNAAKKECEKFISKAGLDKTLKTPYIEDISTKDATVLVYYPRFERLPVFESFIKFYLTDKGIAKAVMHVAKIKPLKEENTKHIIYPIDIVLFGIENHLKLQKPVHITDIILGYYSLGIEGMDILEREIIPVYKITIEGLNEPIFVNAYTNKRINE